MAPPAQARTSQAHAPLWLKVLVVVMGLLIVAGFVVIAAEVARRMSNPNAGRTPARTAYSERIALPPGSQVISINTVGDRLAVHVEDRDGLTTAYIVDPRTGALVGTIAFPPGTGR